MRATQTAFLPILWWLTVALGAAAIDEAFPQGLVYKPPKYTTLLSSAGKDWKYQLSEDLKSTLRTEIRDHYGNFRRGRVDKTCMPLYLFLSGAGTGKSRNATEFHRTAVNCLGDKDEELREKLCNAWVFHTSLENGTSLRPSESDSFRAIGTRMLHQLLPDKSLDQIDFKAPTPMAVLEQVAKGEKKELRDATVILIVDGMQALMDSRNDGHNKDSRFYRTLTAIGDLANQGLFLLPCCTATVSYQVSNCLTDSSRKRVYLPVASLRPPQICENDMSRSVFDSTDTITNILLEDCGGHGRAMELLWILMEKYGAWKHDIGSFMRNLRHNIFDQYEKAFALTGEEVRAIFPLALCHQLLYSTKEVSITGKRPDELAAPGLIRYEMAGDHSSGYLTLPYIWLWLMADKLQLPGWDLDDYGEISAAINPTFPSNCSWENFEKFIVRFRCLKSVVLKDNYPTNISEIHRGARLNGNISFENHRLSPVVALNQTASSTTNANRAEWFVDSTGGRINVREHKHIVINARNAASGDAFLSLHTEPPVNEVHQYKCYGERTSLGQGKYEEERSKAASNADFFILFTTKSGLGGIKPPKNCGIVCGDNWKEYFGPFAGRAFLYRNMMDTTL